MPEVEETEVAEVGAMASSDVVRAMFEAYLAQDAKKADRLLADDVVFTSPQDDHIDKAAFMERCFPTADRVVTQDILSLVDCGEDAAFVMYEYELKEGGVHRNTEFIQVVDGRIVSIDVFFGGDYG